jgi:hypothetical protein
MTVEQREAYWKYQARRHETAWKQKAGDLTPEQVDALRAQAVELETLKRERMTDQERAVAEAVDRARVEARAEIASELVDAKIEAAATGRLSDEQLSALLESIDKSKYLTDEGKVDAGKVTALIDRLAPEGSQPRRFPDLGQGRRDHKPPSSVATGRELFEARKSKAS